MSVIDQAFIKALARRTQGSSNAEATQQVSEPSAMLVSPPDVSINPKSDQSAIVWVDSVADQYLRRDPAQPIRSPQGIGNSVAARSEVPGNATGLGSRGTGVRARGARPVGRSVLQSDSDGNSSVANNSNVTKIPAADFIRDDAAHRSVNAPTGPITPGFTEAADTRPPQPAIGSWIEASSIVVDTPYQRVVGGESFSDSIIVQESYLPPSPLPTASAPALPSQTATPAPSKPLVSVTQQSNSVAARAALPNATPSSEPTAVSTKESFLAVWEVDAFEFSDTFIALFGDANLTKSIGVPLDRAVSEGLQTLLVTSIETGAGRTTVATGIALAAAAAGLRVVLVDATIPSVGSKPSEFSLADALNLEAQVGWIEAVRDGASIAETAIYSIEDQLTVLPLVLAKAGLPPTAEEFSGMIATLRKSFDLIIIDGPPCNEAAFRPLVSYQGDSAAVDAAILVQDMRTRSVEQTNRVMDMLRRDQITGLGVVQNFS